MEVSQTVPATECYVLFLLEQPGASVFEAQKALDERYRDFTAEVSKAFPGIAVTRERADSEPPPGARPPKLRQLVLCTIDPDESKAARLLDFGIGKGLKPFCAAADNGTFGAVYYGVGDPEKTLAELLRTGTRQLLEKAGQYAAMQNCVLDRQSYIAHRISPEEKLRLSYNRVVITLPANFCGSDPDRIPISLTVYGNFELKRKNL
ncbi:MAG: hypothetical protein AB7F32_11370 [Victivallaceae bacterium]